MPGAEPVPAQTRARDPTAHVHSLRILPHNHVLQAGRKLFLTLRELGNPSACCSLAILFLDSDSFFSNIHKSTRSQQSEGSSLAVPRFLTLFL